MWTAARIPPGLEGSRLCRGRKRAIEYRWAEDKYDRLAGAGGRSGSPPSGRDRRDRRHAAALAAKAATTTIPIVFSVGDDPVRLGLVASLTRPGGNLTGIDFLTGELAAKRLELLRELVPGAARVAVLVNPTNAANTEATLRDVEAAARTVGLQIQVLNAAPSARSMPRSKTSGANGPMAYSSRRHRSSTSGVSNGQRWRRFIRIPAAYALRDLLTPAA